MMLFGTTLVWLGCLGFSAPLLAGEPKGSEAVILRLCPKETVKVTYQMSVHCDIRLEDGLMATPGSKAPPIEKEGSFDILGHLQREVRPIGNMRFRVTDTFVSLSVKTTGLLKNQTDSIRAQGKDRNKTAIVDSRGKIVGPMRDQNIEFTPIYLPLSQGGVAPGSKWTDLRKFGPEQIKVQYQLAKGDIKKEWKISQFFLGSSLMSDDGSYTIFDAKTGLPKSGRLRYIQRQRGAVSKVTYEFKTVAP